VTKLRSQITTNLKRYLLGHNPRIEEISVRRDVGPVRESCQLQVRSGKLKMSGELVGNNAGQIEWLRKASGRGERKFRRAGREGGRKNIKRPVGRIHVPKGS